MRVCLVLMLCALCCLVPLGCQDAAQSKLEGETLSLGDNFDETILVFGTARLLGECYVNMVTTSAEAARNTEQFSVRESSIRWRILTAGRLDRVRSLTDPRIRFTALWTLAAQMRIAFSEGEYKERFGDQQYRYQDFARAYEKSVIDLAYQAFPDDVVRQVVPEIDNFARTVGVSGWFIPRGAPEQARGALSQLISVPLSPISGLQGVGDTPGAINRFTDAARDMTRVVENLPERTRWQIELMLLEAETSGATATALKEIALTRQAVEQVSSRFPEQLRQLLQDPTLAENLDRVQASLKLAGQVSEQFRNTLAEFRLAVADVRQTLMETQQASAAVQKASADVHLTVESIRDRDHGDPTTRPADKDKFRITDVETAAATVQQAAAEIRHVIAEARAEGGIPAFDLGAQRAERLVTRLTWSIAILIGVAFLAALALLLIWRILGRRAKT